MTTITKAHRANLLVSDKGYINTSYSSDDADAVIKCYGTWKASGYKDDNQFYESFSGYLITTLGGEYSELAITRTSHESSLLCSFMFIKHYLEPRYNRIVLFSNDNVLIIPLKYLEGSK